MMESFAAHLKMEIHFQRPKEQYKEQLHELWIINNVFYA